MLDTLTTPLQHQRHSEPLSLSLIGFGERREADSLPNIRDTDVRGVRNLIDDNPSTRRRGALVFQAHLSRRFHCSR